MIKNGIHHIRSSPYHPASNGLAERAVRVFKEGFKKMKEGTISDKIARFLFSYRNLPHSTTGVSPAELMFGRQLHSRLDLLKPSLESRVEDNQQRQKKVMISMLGSDSFVFLTVFMFVILAKVKCGFLASSLK